MIVTITELRCKNYWKLPGLILLSMKVASQAKKTQGNISTLIRAKGLKANTLTTWETPESLKSFRNFGHHKQAMKAMNRTASSFRSKTWESETTVGWDEALAKLTKVEMKFT